MIYWPPRQSWLDTIDNQGETHLVSLDTSKAFDPVQHKVLTKPSKLGLPSAFVTWTLGFLSVRAIFIPVGRSLSKPLFCNTSIHNSSDLSPPPSFCLPIDLHPLPPKIIPSLMTVFPIVLLTQTPISIAGVAFLVFLKSPWSCHNHGSFSAFKMFNLFGAPFVLPRLVFWPDWFAFHRICFPSRITH